MTPEIWKECILDSVSNIADKEFQKKSWFGGTEYVSSPEEVYCQLFDDFIFDDFLDSTDISLTKEQRNSGNILRDKLNEYLKTLDVISDPEEVFNDPIWEDIRNSAQEFLATFRKS